MIYSSLFCVMGFGVCLWGCIQLGRYFRCSSYKKAKCFFDDIMAINHASGDVVVNVSFYFFLATKKYNGNRIYSLGECQFGGSQLTVNRKVDVFMNKFKKGECYDVYYNMENPSDNFLINGPLHQIYIPFFIGITAVFMAYLCW